MNVKYTVKSVLMENTYETKDLMQALIFIKEKFDIEAKVQSKFEKNVADEFYAMKLDALYYDKQHSSRSSIIIKPSHYKKWTGKEIEDIKSYNDFEKILVTVNNALLLDHKKNYRNDEMSM